MAQKTIYVDDLTGDEVDETTAHRGVKFTVNGTEGKPLDLSPVTYDALAALVLNGDPDGVRAVFAPDTVVRRTKTEIDHIRSVAREFGGFDVKDTGRLPRAVITWFETEYLPAQENSGVQDDAGDAESPAETPDSEPETPTRRGRRS